LNCCQVRELLATYREVQHGQVDTTALEEHLQNCLLCRQYYEQQKSVGEHIRMLPSIGPNSEAHTKLMQALAVEHVRYLRQASAATPAPPPPAFLKPYLSEQLSHAQRTDSLTAFSTADTGPMPIVQLPKKQRKRGVPGHFTILGLAAAILMVIMMGGLTTLLLLAHNGLSGVGDTASIHNFVQVSRTNYTTATPYTHIVSAVANRNTIYYTAYGDGNIGWMIEEFDIQTNFSTPLLAEESTSPLVVLGSNQNWLVWLQIDSIKPSNNKSQHVSDQTRTWTLYGMDLDSQNNTPTPLALLKGTFDRNTAPRWVNNPIQGTWLTQSNLLVASIDNKGNSHLWNFQLNPAKIATPTQIASTGNGRVFTSPTANADNSSIYWSEEWRTDDSTLHGNIWTQQTTKMPRKAGKWAGQVDVEKYLYRSDGMSFHPQLVNNVLFFLSTNPAAITGTIQDQPTVVGGNRPAMASTVTPQVTSTDAAAVTTRVDPAILPPSLDTTLQGALIAISTENGQSFALDTSGLDTIPQGGTRFILWENSAKGMEMYDTVTKAPVTVKDVVPITTTYLTVNGETAIWVDNSANANPVNSQVNMSSPTVTFSLFDWPANAN
jgi:hypothetical protein